jgi:hypothetical protein
MSNCKSEAAIERFISFCEQQAHDLLTPHGRLIVSLQIILPMRRDMTGEELDQALATVLAQFELAAERRRRADWRKCEMAASGFRANVDNHSDAAPLPRDDPDQRP